MCDNPNHPITIEDTDYLRVVKKSIDTSKSKVSDQRSKVDSDLYLTNSLSKTDVNNYWKQFLYAFPEDRLKLWDIFDKAIKKYYQTLHCTRVCINRISATIKVYIDWLLFLFFYFFISVRYKKTKEVEQLETENMELKKILKQFMDAQQVFYVIFHALSIRLGNDSHKILIEHIK